MPTIPKDDLSKLNRKMKKKSASTRSVKRVQAQPNTLSIRKRIEALKEEREFEKEWDL